MSQPKTHLLPPSPSNPLQTYAVELARKVALIKFKIKNETKKTRWGEETGFQVSCWPLLPSRRHAETGEEVICWLWGGLKETGIQHTTNHNQGTFSPSYMYRANSMAVPALKKLCIFELSPGCPYESAVCVCGGR
ncbi:UNVERIFIED_CONTAM: hypothetical protein K2H54_025020 [Gekko kuhli]